MNGLGASTLSGGSGCTTASAQQRLLVPPLTELVIVVPFFCSDLLEPPTRTPIKLPPVEGCSDSGLPLGPNWPTLEIETEVPLDQIFSFCPPLVPPSLDLQVVPSNSTPSNGPVGPPLDAKCNKMHMRQTQNISSTVL